MVKKHEIMHNLPKFRKKYNRFSSCFTFKLHVNIVFIKVVLDRRTSIKSHDPDLLHTDLQIKFYLLIKYDNYIE